MHYCRSQIESMGVYMWLFSSTLLTLLDILKSFKMEMNASAKLEPICDAATSTISKTIESGLLACSRCTITVTYALWFGDVQASVMKFRWPSYSCLLTLLLTHIQDVQLTFSIEATLCLQGKYHGKLLMAMIDSSAAILSSSNRWNLGWQQLEMANYSQWSSRQSQPCCGTDIKLEESLVGRCCITHLVSIFVWGLLEYIIFPFPLLSKWAVIDPSCSFATSSQASSMVFLESTVSAPLHPLYWGIV